MYIYAHLASFPGALGNWGEERLVSTVRACAAPQVFVGSLETTVILVRVARPHITETARYGAVYFTEYLSVLFQLTYLDKLYGECNGTASACVNSGYQALFSPRAPGNEANAHRV